VVAQHVDQFRHGDALPSFEFHVVSLGDGWVRWVFRVVLSSFDQ
jgi:hypothetical protein